MGLRWGRYRQQAGRLGRLCRHIDVGIRESFAVKRAFNWQMLMGTWRVVPTWRRKRFLHCSNNKFCLEQQQQQQQQPAAVSALILLFFLRLRHVMKRESNSKSLLLLHGVIDLRRSSDSSYSYSCSSNSSSVSGCSN